MLENSLKRFTHMTIIHCYERHPIFLAVEIIFTRMPLQIIKVITDLISDVLSKIYHSRSFSGKSNSLLKFSAAHAGRESVQQVFVLPLAPEARWHGTHTAPSPPPRRPKPSSAANAGGGDAAARPPGCRSCAGAPGPNPTLLFRKSDCNHPTKSR